MSEQMPCGVTDDYDYDEWCEKNAAARVDELKDYYYDDEILAMMEEADGD